MLGFMGFRRSLLASMVIAGALLSACTSSKDDANSLLSSPATVSGSTHAVVATYQGETSALSVVQAAAPYASEHQLLATVSDADIVGFGGYVYRFERYNRDNIAKFDAKTLAANSAPLWQFSTLDAGETGSGNVHDMVFVSDTKAYLIRYGKARAWIVNPAATTQEEFKIGELDLSAIADADGIPEMEAGIVVGNKLFIIVQRLDQDNGWVPGDAYVVVYDVTTDTVVNTATNTENGAIRLAIHNPGSIEFNARTQKIYVSGIGSYFSDDKTSGVVELDPITYATKTILDSKNQEANTPAFQKIDGVEILNANKGYFIDYVGWGNSALREFNPSTGAVSESAIADLKGINLAALTSDGNGRLWVGDSTNHQIVIVDTTDNLVVEKIDTVLNPGRVTFVNN